MHPRSAVRRLTHVAQFMADSAVTCHPPLMRAPALLATLLLCWGITTAHADAMRCGSRLVTFGDTRAAVRSLCGEPTDVQTRSILRRPTYDLRGRVIYFGDGYIEIPVEVWTYNFGPYKLMRQVRFVDGRVDEIETIGYGYREKGE
jgi:hypothetical protein